MAVQEVTNAKEQVSLATQQATLATTKATEAEDSATSASQSATAASNSAKAAKLSADNAALSKTAAGTSEVNAKASEVEAKKQADLAKGYAEDAASGQLNADWEVTDPKSKAFIKNKPTLGALASKDSIAYSEITGTPPAQDLSGLATKKELQTGLAGKANASHTHTTAQVTGLDTALAGKANSSHTHTSADVTDLNVTISNALKPYATTNTVNAELAKKANEVHTHTVSQITDMPNVVLSVNAIKPSPTGDVSLGLHAVATSGDYNDLANKPSMPATPKAYITETWRSGAQWYRRWSDGRLEQGGRLKLEVWTGGPDPTRTFSLPTAFSNATYTTVVTGEGGYGWATLKGVSQTTSSVTVTGTGASTDHNVSYVHFYCSGY